ncbi:MAG: hypothetical protein K2Z81_17740 [Cyanobacteria bacterium]|nr:hypothetical protein [Cyanobacteriota bacterium]
MYKRQLFILSLIVLGVAIASQSRWDLFWVITLVLLSPNLLYVICILTIGIDQGKAARLALETYRLCRVFQFLPARPYAVLEVKALLLLGTLCGDDPKQYDRELWSLETAWASSKGIYYIPEKLVLCVASSYARALRHHKEDIAATKLTFAIANCLGSIQVKKGMMPDFELVQAMTQLAVSFEKLEEFERTLKIFQRCLDITADYNDTIVNTVGHNSLLLQNLGSCLIDCGRIEEAFAPLTLANSTIRDDDKGRSQIKGAALNNLGRYYTKTNKLPEAEFCLQAAERMYKTCLVENAESWSHNHTYYADFFLAQGKLEEAKAKAEQARFIDQKQNYVNPNTLDLLARISHAQGFEEEARQYGDEARKTRDSIRGVVEKAREGLETALSIEDLLNLEIRSVPSKEGKSASALLLLRTRPGFICAAAFALAVGSFFIPRTHLTYEKEMKKKLADIEIRQKIFEREAEEELRRQGSERTKRKSDRSTDK